MDDPVPCIDCIVLPSCRATIKPSKNHSTAIVLSKLIPKCCLLRDFVTNWEQTHESIRLYGENALITVYPPSLDMVIDYLLKEES